MSIDEVVQYYGNLFQACLALGIAPQNMSKWKLQGYIPMKQQLRLAILTDGYLVADAEDPYKNPRKVRIRKRV